MSSNGENIFISNLGGTSTKVAIYQGEKEQYKETIQHSVAQMKQFGSVWDQMDMRRADLCSWISSKGWEIEDFNMLVSMCGLLRPCDAGVYYLDENMLADMRSEEYGRHPSNPGCAIAYELGQKYGIPAVTMDPSNSEEMLPVAFYSGHPRIRRQCAYHVLNHRAVAHRLSEEKLDKKFEETRLIIAHMGSGITIGAFADGRVLDVNNGIEGDGPFTTVRSGAVPVGQLVSLCYSGEFTEQEMHNQLSVSGGLAGYLGTTDGVEIEKRIRSGDTAAQEAVEAMIFQTSKEIGARAIPLRGRVDAIAVTGGLANWERVTEGIRDWVSHIAPVYVYPGENELEAMAAGALRCLRGEEKIKIFGKD
ncbi:MAG: butyrate kinase [Clostridiales Family XIII bacterium]|jgi:butyrate kinase|nr:butyrate kinase [Clostridiales Family XIII bacterium]